MKIAETLGTVERERERESISLVDKKIYSFCGAEKIAFEFFYFRNRNSKISQFYVG